MTSEYACQEFELPCSGVVMCCSNIAWVPEGSNVYSHVPELITAPAEPNVAAAQIHRAPLERRSKRGTVTINIWSLRDPSNVRATQYYPTTNCLIKKVQTVQCERGSPDNIAPLF